MLLSSPLQCPSGCSRGQLQPSSNKSTRGRRGGHTQGLCQEKFMVGYSSSCFLEGAGCRCFPPPQLLACLGLYLYFPSARPIPPMAPHGPSSPQGSQSHSPPAAGVASATQTGTGTGTRPRPRPWSRRPQAPLGFCQRPQNRIYRPCTQIPRFHSALEGNYNHNHSLSGALT